MTDNNKPVWYKWLKTRSVSQHIIAIAFILASTAAVVQHGATIFNKLEGVWQWVEEHIKSQEIQEDVQKADRIYFYTGQREKAGALYEQAAQKGDVYAKASLAKLLFHGWAGVSSDQKRAHTLSQEVLNVLSIEAEKKPKYAYILGLLNEDGIGIKSDLDQAKHHYLAAAKNGFAPAQFALGLIYRNKDNPKNNKRAMELYKSAALQGHVLAMYHLANGYRYGLTGSVDMQQAKKWFSDAKQLKLADAALALASMHENNEFAQANKTDAANLYKEAMSLGSIQGQSNYASMLFFGLGIAEDKLKAVKLWQEAADKKEPSAQYYLAQRYRYGDVEGISIDLDESNRLYTLAAKANITAAQLQLVYDYRLGLGSSTRTVDYEQAKHWAEKCKDHDPDCLTQLGVLYLRGQGVEQDKDKAKDYFQQAEKLDSAFAAYQLALLLAQEGTTKPTINQKRLRLLQKAAKLAPGEGSYWFEIGNMYHSELPGLNNNQTAASEAYLKAANADQPSPAAASYIGWRYYKGFGISQNLRQAKKYLIKAAKLGSKQALINLNELRVLDIFPNMTQQELDEWQEIGLQYKEKEEAYNFCKLNNLAQRYEKADYTPEGKIEKANELYLRSAQLGSSVGAYNYARLQFFDRRLRMPNLQEGLKWLEWSAQQKFASAHLLLARLHLEKKIVPEPNKDDALHHFAQAKRYGIQIEDVANIDAFPRTWVSLLGTEALSCLAN